MAQHNIVHLYGIVAAEPMAKTDENGNVVYASGMIATYPSGMRPFEGTINLSNLGVCQVPIRSGEPEMASEIAALRKFDIVIIKGSLNTRNVLKTLICQECGEKFYVEKAKSNDEEREDNKKEGSMITFVTPIDMDVRERSFGDQAQPILREMDAGHADDTGVQNDEYIHMLENELAVIENNACKFILKRRELSNEVQIVGNLCADPMSWENGNATSYQVGVNRKFYLIDDDPKISSDFPFVRSYGVQADNDIEALHETSLVLVDGFLKRRMFNRTSICPYCGTQRVWKSSVVEVVPYSVEYLSNYKNGEARRAEKDIRKGFIENNGGDNE